mmetsp:Transcript_27964/g.70308  ORF Transcript_27964/g.70308 Transcript_27964/m.70308 type:complete len:268 (-) Transcript_27964:25-828(-)
MPNASRFSALDACLEKCENLGLMLPSIWPSVAFRRGSTWPRLVSSSMLHSDRLSLARPRCAVSLLLRKAAPSASLPSLCWLDALGATLPFPMLLCRATPLLSAGPSTSGFPGATRKPRTSGLPCISSTLSRARALLAGTAAGLVEDNAKEAVISAAAAAWSNGVGIARAAISASASAMSDAKGQRDGSPPLPCPGGIAGGLPAAAGGGMPLALGGLEVRSPRYDRVTPGSDTTSTTPSREPSKGLGCALSCTNPDELRGPPSASNPV